MVGLELLDHAHLDPQLSLIFNLLDALLRPPTERSAFRLPAGRINKNITCPHMQRPQAIERVLPPAVVADFGQHGLGGQPGRGQHLHGLGCGPVQQVPCRGHGGSDGLGPGERQRQQEGQKT